MDKKSSIEGLFYYDRRRQPIVCAAPYQREAAFYRLPQQYIKKYHLTPGARLDFTADKYQVDSLLAINGRPPEQNGNNTRFEKLTVINPVDKFSLEHSQDKHLRIIDLISPLAKGSRSLIISPPKAGKTMLLEKFALFFAAQKQLRTFLLLIDERPEEITQFRRNTGLPVFFSSLDSGHDSHTRLVELIMRNIRQEIEAKNDVVVLIDSLTRLGRAHNLNDTRSRGRIMSGGIGARALELPRKLFGMARNIENGGSCTIIATILHNTGSRMDEYIFQEFKGTGNSELLLAGDLAEQRIYPAVDIKQSGTRREDLLRSDWEMDKVNYLRRLLAKENKNKAIEKLLRAMDKYPDNTSLLKSI